MPDLPDLSPEFRFRTSRSGGPGGQHANKANTRVQLLFPLRDSKLLPRSLKKKALERLNHRLTNEGELIIERSAHRSQKKNKEEAVKGFYRTLRKAVQRPKPRKTTKKPQRAEEERIRKKKERSEKKRLRKTPNSGRDH